ncbi:MAG: uridylate kinase [Hyphomicrobium sp.]
MPPIVVKIGGSLANTGRAREILGLVARSPRRIIVVPGGGAYANAVRRDQAAQGFPDTQAHRLAILSMHRMATDFQSLQPRLRPVTSIVDITGVLSKGHKALWLPWPMVEHQVSIPQDWSMTSDGLAAWLAGQIPAAEVALVKSCVVPAQASLFDLAEAGITDTQFPAIVGQAELGWHVLGAGDDARLSGLLGIPQTQV